MATSKETSEINIIRPSSQEKAIKFSFQSVFQFEFKLLDMMADGEFVKTKKRTTMTIFVLCMLILFIAGNTTNTILSPNVPTFSNNMMYTGGVWCAFLKGCYLLIFRKDLARIYRSIRSDPKFLPRNDEEEKIVMAGFRLFKISRRVCAIMCLMAEAFLLLSCFDRNECLPAATWSPYDVTYPTSFLFFYINQLISLSILVLLYVFPISTLIGVSSFIGIECDLISYNLENFPPEETTLKRIIEKHISILRLAKDCRNLINAFFFIDFIFMSVVLSTGLYSISEASFMDFLVFVDLEVSIGTTTFVQCLFVDDMKRKSERIFRAAYETPWVDASPSFKKELIIFMQNAQEPITFNKLGFIPVSLESFNIMIRGSYSYYTVLQNLNHSGSI